MKAILLTLLVFIVCLHATPDDLSSISRSNLDQYGGYRKIQRRASGFFRVERVNQRWTFITPAGHPFLAIGANHIGKFLENPEDSHKLLDRFDGNRADAVEALVRAMREVNLTAGEAYGPLLDTLKPHFPYIEYVPFPDDNKWRFDVFDSDVRSRLERHVVERCRAFASDPNVLGVGFADLPVWNRERMDFIRSLSSQAAGKKRWVAWLVSRFRTIQDLNEAYGTSFAAFASLEEPLANFPDTAAVQRDDGEFLGVMADSLYQLLRSAAKAGAPNHLFFGEKFVARLYPEPVVRAVGRHVDVYLTQALILSPQRPPEWQEFQPDGYLPDYELIGNKPIIVVDWAPPFSLDETYPTDRGELRDERTASDEAATWIEEAFRQPYIVGVFWCQMIGSHGNDRWFPKGRMKRTLVQDDATPFEYRTGRIARTHREILEREYGKLN